MNGIAVTVVGVQLAVAVVRAVNGGEQPRGLVAGGVHVSRGEVGDGLRVVDVGVGDDVQAVLVGGPGDGRLERTLLVTGSLPAGLGRRGQW